MLPISTVFADETNEPPPVSITVLNFSSQDAPEHLIKRLAAGIVKELKDNKALALIESSSMGAALCSNDNCAAAVGRALGVKKIIWGTIEKKGNLYKIEARLTDTDSGKSNSALDVEVTESDIEFGAKISSFGLISDIPEVKQAKIREETRIKEEARIKESKIAKFSLFAGGEANLLAVNSIAAGPYLGVDYRYNKSLAFGLKAGGSFSGNITSAEASLFGRWYFISLSNFYEAELFAQAELGANMMRMDYGKTVQTFLGGAVFGMRVGEKWFAEPYIRAGYPHGVGAGIMFGRRL
jgi:TolB-like protein